MALVDLNGRGAVVLGGGGGIGRGIALSLAKEGMRVLVADINADNAAAVAEELRAVGATATSAFADATDHQSLAGVAAQASDTLGDVHLLVHMVGINSDSPVTDSDDNTWAWYYDLNIAAVVRSVEAFLPLLRAHGDGGHVVVTASMAGLVSLPLELSGGVNLGLYTVFKHAMVGYGQMLRHELAAEGIGVSVLCPGVVDTKLSANSAQNRPARFGGPIPEPQLSIATRMQPEAVGPIVVRGVLANRGFIFTHPERLDMFRTYAVQPVLDDFEFFSQPAD